MSTHNIHCTIFNLKKRITVYYPKSAAMGFLPRDSRTNSKQPWKTGKRAISVRATEGLLYTLYLEVCANGADTDEIAYTPVSTRYSQSS